MSPADPPREDRPRTLHSHLILMKMIVNDAAVIPHDWIRTEKSRAMVGLMLKARVMTGKAIAPPPSLVIPTVLMSIFVIIIT